MQEMFTSSKRPFYQSTQPLTIGPIQQDEYASFATRLFAARNVKLPLEVFNSIYEKYEGHTWYVQCLLNRLYGYDRDVDMELVAYATEQILSEYSYTYANLLKAYSSGQVRLESNRQGGLCQGGSGRGFYQCLQTSGGKQCECDVEKIIGKRAGLPDSLWVYNLRPFYE